MRPEIALKRRVTKQLNNIIEKENISIEVAIWIKHFEEDANEIPLNRLAQHVKAAITGRAAIARRVNKSEHERLLRICDEINTMFPGDWNLNPTIQ
jgi:hypothetical protein